MPKKKLTIEQNSIYEVETKSGRALLLGPPSRKASESKQKALVMGLTDESSSEEELEEELRKMEEEEIEEKSSKKSSSNKSKQ
jgi:hypothetical protein